MPQNSKTNHGEAERAELDRVVDALARWPRLSQLLQYMVAKVFSNEIEQINEYNIATEVLGRSKTLFNAAEDAIARVETHRLRKRLASFYEIEGKDHSVQITLPAGSYVPVFVHKREEVPMRGPTESGAAPAALSTKSESHADENRGKLPLLGLIRHWKYSVTGVCVFLVALGAYLYFHARQSRSAATAETIASPVALSVPPSTISGPVRLLAGYSGLPRTDSAGNVWNPDQFFSGGGAWQRVPGPIARTSAPFIFEHWRTGDFSYSIPLKPGSYDVHLFFSTPSEAVSTFNVSIRRGYLLVGFDVNEDALGENIADERVFRGVSPEPDGFLHIGFAGAMGPPSLNAIEILPSAGRAQNPVRLIMQTTPQTDSQGRTWHEEAVLTHAK